MTTTEDAVIGLTMDRSGSMWSMWDEAVAGYNTFKNEQAALDSSTWLVSTYFDNEVVTWHDGTAAEDIGDLAKDDPVIHPRSMTALIDATLSTIKRTEDWLSAHPNFDGRVYQVIITDGMENASESKPSALKEKVTELEERGWEFIYLAANVDLEATSRAYGFNLNSSMVYDSHTVGAAYSTTSDAITRSRTAGDKVEL